MSSVILFDALVQWNRTRLFTTFVSASFNFVEVLYCQFDIMDDGCSNDESFPAARLKLVSPNRLLDTTFAFFYLFIFYVFVMHILLARQL